MSHLQQESSGPSTSKAPKACVNCRRQKMKCKVDQGPACRRCLRNDIECIFKPRANAASLRERLDLLSSSGSLSPTQIDDRFLALINRLDNIESHLGLDAKSQTSSPAVTRDVTTHISDPEDTTFAGLWKAVASLKTTTRGSHNRKVWSRPNIKELWLSFHTNMPGLHFLPNQQSFSSPTPILLSSMLYVSSLHHPSADLANLAPDYFSVMCGAIAELSIPQPETPSTDAGVAAKATAAQIEEWAFQDVLGLLLACLSADSSIRTTGVWISIGYRLVVEYCPVQIDDRSREWQKLFSGLQIIDLEHASLHMACPIIPLHAPMPRLHISEDDHIHSLTVMMHTGLTHFTGRGLPTIWSFFSPIPEARPRLTTPFTGVDAAMIRDWARQLDEWLARFNGAAQNTTMDRPVIFRQYILHRLLVLSIYHPARGFLLFSHTTTPHERHELLVSARAAIRLQLSDKTIWSNWDLVMITWAALLVLQGVEGGVGEEDDLQMVQMHLNILRSSPSGASEGSFRGRLARRLEGAFQGMSSPPADMGNMNGGVVEGAADPLEWSIFDQMSMQFAWPVEEQSGFAGAGGEMTVQVPVQGGQWQDGNSRVRDLF